MCGACLVEWWMSWVVSGYGLPITPEYLISKKRGAIFSNFDVSIYRNFRYQHPTLAVLLREACRDTERSCSTVLYHFRGRRISSCGLVQWTMHYEAASCLSARRATKGQLTASLCKGDCKTPTRNSAVRLTLNIGKPKQSEHFFL